MYYKYSFEKLEVWQDSKELVKQVYSITKKFPDDEKFGLTAQLRRAKVSVFSNLAEGTSRITSLDKAKFTTISFSSLMEVLNQIIIAHELNFLNTVDYEHLRSEIDKVSNKLNALRSAQLKE